MKAISICVLLIVVLLTSKTTAQDFSISPLNGSFDSNNCGTNSLTMGINNHLGRSFSWEVRSKNDGGEWTDWAWFANSTPTSTLFYHTHYHVTNISVGVTYQFRIKLTNSNPVQYSNALEKYVPGKNGGILTYTINKACRTGVDKVTLNLSNYLGQIVRWEYRVTYWNKYATPPAFVTTPWSSFSSSNVSTIEYSMPVLGPADEFNSTNYDFRAFTNNNTCEAKSNEVLSLFASTQDPSSIAYYNITANKTLQISGDGNYYISMCDGDSVVLTGNHKTGFESYFEWSTGAKTRSITVKKAGTYTFIATWTQPGCERYGPEKIVTVDVMSNPKPKLSTYFGPVTEPYICANGNIGLSSSDAHAYYWSDGSTTKQITAHVGGTYFVETVQRSGCGRKSDPVTIRQIPLILTQDKTICSGQSTNLSLTSDYNDATFSWVVHNKSANITGVTIGTSGSSNPINDVLVNTTSAQGTVTYKTTAYANLCTGVEKYITVNVKPAPIITISPLVSSVCLGGSGVTVSASGASTYNWSPSSGLSSTTGPTIVANPLATTTYTVIGTNSTGCSNTAQVIVTVKPKPSVTNTNKTICSGDPVNLSLTSDISGAAFSWVVQSKSSTISGTTVGATGTANLINHILTNSSSTAAGSVVYRITPTANSCAGNYKDITIMVNASVSKPTITILGSICDQYVTLRANASGATDYQWSTSNNSQTVNMLSSGTYTVTAYYPNGCSRISDPITITIPTCSDPCDPYLVDGGRVPDPPCLEELQKAELIIEETTAYPNPADAEITVHLPAPAEYDIPVKMYSQFGQTIHLATIQKGETKIELKTSDLTGGIYLIQLQLKGQKSFNRKVMVAHNR
jgi:hypothetical protein